ncbi:MAG TPA: DUF6541 family protein [Chloroflexia bacterium]|nr:DUF6541 family protein [Chloroflexia bacterium]
MLLAPGSWREVSMDFGSPQIYAHVVVALMALTLPGTALYLAVRRIFKNQAGPNPIYALSVGAGLSVAFWPLLLFYLTLLGLGIAAFLLWIVLVAAAIYVAYYFRAQRRQSAQTTSSEAIRRERLLAGLTLGMLVLMSLAFRLGDIQGLTVPMFGDSLHHTMVTDLILRSGRVPANYLPYVPTNTFTYHFGFHTLAAVFGQLTGSGAPYAVLLVGQVLNVLALPVAYALNRRLFASRAAGLGAALLTGFVSIMPAYYVNWGRYTQLAGHVLLLVALVFTVRLMSRERKRSDFALVAVCVAGLVVVHYRILIFFGLFGLALGAWQLFTGWRDVRGLLIVWSRGIAAVLVGLAATLPWLANLSTNYFPILTVRLGTVSTEYLAEYNDPGSIVIFAGRVLPALALVGLALALAGFLRRKAGKLAPTGPSLTPNAASVVIALWTALLVGSLWVVPGAIGGYTVAITLYIPLAALGGYAIGRACEWLGAKLRRPEGLVAVGLLGAAPILAIALGPWHLIDPGSSQYVHPADHAAFDWIETNVPQDAKFLISSEFTYQGRGVTASDAGMWLPLLTGRLVSLPALSAWVERPIEPDFFTDTRKLAAYTQPHSDTSDRSTQALLVSKGIIPQARTLTDPETLVLMRKLGVTHVYSGAKAGKSNPRLDIESMQRDTAHYRLLYFEGGVYIFEVVYGP